MMSDNDVVTLVAVGDIMLGDHPICIGHGVGSLIKKKGPGFVFENVSDILNKADIAFGNLESVLSDIEIDHDNIKSVQLRGSESSVEGIVSAGFDMMSIANNHIMEHGERSLIKTRELLSGNKIMTAGVSESKMSSREPVILDRKGITFGFLAYCLVPDKTAYRSVEDPHEIVNDVRKFRDDVDILIVSLHWGNEFIRKPSPYQFTLAHDIIDAGADLILGHHPHVLQGVESYNNGVIVYSMGNFVFDMWQKKMRESIIFSCSFSRNGIEDVEIIPAYINDHYQPTPLHGKDRETLLSKIGSDFLELVDENTYQKEVRDCRKQYRLALVRHLITNFYRYRFTYLYQILENFVRK
ncbi:MAG: CapA family protein [Halobacteriota archaeon]